MLTRVKKDTDPTCYYKIILNNKLYMIVKKFILPVTVSFVALSSLSSCAVGSFAVLNKCWEFNNNVTDNKYVKSIIAFVLFPFEVSIGGFIDTVILNTIEFWNGSNPLAEVSVVLGSDGNYYAISSDKEKGYIITNQTTNISLHLRHEADSRTWFAECNGESQKLITFVDQENAIVYTSDGTSKKITLNEQGLMACQQIFADDCNLSMK